MADPPVHTVLRRLRTLGDPVSVAGMARFGINPAKTLGVRIPVLRRMAREIGKDHALALALWKSRYHEARILASMIDAVNEVSAAQMEQWVKDFDSWDVCDQCCLNLFAKTPYAWDKARAWSARRGEFVKRAGFVMMACLAVSDKGAPDAAFARFFPIIRRAAGDGRNFVKKAANWALRQIGKRSRGLRRRAIAEARAIRKIDAPAARWIANDALRELQDPATRLRR